MSSVKLSKENLYIQNLKDIKEVFDQYNIQFWLDSGTLLGAIRDKKILDWDEDIDIGMREEYFKKIPQALPRFKEKGFVVNEVPVPIPNSDSTHKRFSLFRFGYVVDIWGFYLKDGNWTTFLSSWVFDKGFFMKNLSRISWFLWRLLLSAEISSQNKLKQSLITFIKYWSYLLSSKFKKFLIKKIGKKLSSITIMIVIPQKYFEKLESAEYYGIPFNVPFEVENYLAYRYGESWRTPQRNWDWVKDDSSVKSLNK